MCGVIVALVYSTENKSISHGLANSVILFLFELCSKLYSLSLSLSLCCLSRRNFLQRDLQMSFNILQRMECKTPAARRFAACFTLRE